jgi:hypothetical protein
MEFDRHVAQLQGALLAPRSPKFPDHVSNILDAAGGDRRKLFVCLLVNADGAVDVSRLSERQAVLLQPFLDLFRVTVDELFEVVERCRLWAYLYEALAVLPVSPAVMQHGGLLARLADRRDDFGAASVIAAVVRDRFYESPFRPKTLGLNIFGGTKLRP